MYRIVPTSSHTVRLIGRENAETGIDSECSKTYSIRSSVTAGATERRYNVRFYRWRTTTTYAE